MVSHQCSSGTTTKFVPYTPARKVMGRNMTLTTCGCWTGKCRARGFIQHVRQIQQICIEIQLWMQNAQSDCRSCRFVRACLQCRARLDWRTCQEAPDSGPSLAAGGGWHCVSHRLRAAAWLPAPVSLSVCGLCDSARRLPETGSWHQYCTGVFSVIQPTAGIIMTRRLHCTDHARTGDQYVIPWWPYHPTGNPAPLSVLDFILRIT